MIYAIFTVYIEKNRICTKISNLLHGLYMAMKYHIFRQNKIILH